MDGAEHLRWRVFCAVELPTDVKERIGEHIARLRRAAPHARAGWERPQKLHITLKFLGDTEPSRVEGLSRALERAASGARPFKFTLKGTGAFPARGIPRVLWLGVSDVEGGLALVHRLLEEACALEGFRRETRAFHPHLTLARLCAPADARLLARLHQETPFVAESVGVGEIVAVRSELLPEGARHTVLSRHKLNAGGPDNPS